MHRSQQLFLEKDGYCSMDKRPQARTTLGVILILVAAGISMLFSIVLWFFVDQLTGIFVGVWVPSILALGALLTAARR
jgi:CHASE2 domain-containing sensor protein